MPDRAMIWQLAPGVCKERVGQDMVLLDTRAGEYFELNDSGARMVELLDQLGSCEAVVEVLEQEYEADTRVLTRELQHLIEQLQVRHLLENRRD